MNELWLQSPARPEVVCLCGSTRFRQHMQEVNRDLTLGGAIVLAPGVFAHAGDRVTTGQKLLLDRLHRVKISLADRVVVVAPGRYIGESTRAEIAYANRLGKPVEIWDVGEELE